MQRRSLLKLGAGAGLVLAATGAGLALFRPGWQGGQLTPAGLDMFRAVASAVLGDFLPAAATERDQALAAHLARLQLTLSGLSPGLQAEVAQLSAVLCTAPARLALVGLATDWAEASTAQVQQALQTLRLSRWSVRQQTYHALRDLTNAAWFSDATAWQAIGYPGPRPV